ncbi:MAG: glycine--tRNA ligase subunit beta [Pseudomonadota bacterium]
MSNRDLLIELGTEELPPKSLRKLAQAFADNLGKGLSDAGVAGSAVTPYAAPRRMAVLVEDVPQGQADSDVQKRGPALAAAYDADGNPTKAAQGFARSCGVDVADLDQLETDKGTWLVFSEKKTGSNTVDLIQGIVEQAINALPIPKRMRWGDKSVEFVRPLHWVCALFGDQGFNLEVLGVRATTSTYGHRFHAPKPIALSHASDYVSALSERAFVIADFAQRKEKIVAQVEVCAQQAGGVALVDADLLDEVTALVEWPVALVGEFDQRYLDVPEEALITTLQDNQKYFPLRDASGKLMAKFITVSNIESSNPQAVKAGNERVVRPRLADAQFFWEQDRKRPLAARAEALGSVLFQKQLGSVADKSARVCAIALSICDACGANADDVKRAAALAKCDLLTDMVGEFANLQGVMGEYYARHDGEREAVCVALREQYLPRSAGDTLPSSPVGQALAVAERIDTLVGIFAIGQKPTGVKDPFALRRAALGVLRILIECDLSIDLRAMLVTAAGSFSAELNAQDCIDDVFDFVHERLRAYYAERSVSPQIFDAVLSVAPTVPSDFDKRIDAVVRFAQMEEAESLAAANKRTRNILKKAELTSATSVDPNLLSQAEESTLFSAMQAHADKAEPLFAAREYTGGLQVLAGLREPVDAFFDHVMVMADDDTVRNNRLALLQELASMFARVADISRLSGS